MGTSFRDSVDLTVDAWHAGQYRTGKGLGNWEARQRREGGGGGVSGLYKNRPVVRTDPRKPRTASITKGKIMYANNDNLDVARDGMGK